MSGESTLYVVADIDHVEGNANIIGVYDREEIAKQVMAAAYADCSKTKYRTCRLFICKSVQLNETKIPKYTNKTIWRKEKHAYLPHNVSKAATENESGSWR